MKQYTTILITLILFIGCEKRSLENHNHNTHLTKEITGILNDTVENTINNTQDTLEMDFVTMSRQLEIKNIHLKSTIYVDDTVYHPTIYASSYFNQDKLCKHIINYTTLEEVQYQYNNSLEVIRTFLQNGVIQDQSTIYFSDSIQLYDSLGFYDPVYSYNFRLTFDCWHISYAKKQPNFEGNYYYWGTPEYYIEYFYNDRGWKEKCVWFTHKLNQGDTVLNNRMRVLEYEYDYFEYAKRIKEVLFPI